MKFSLDNNNIEELKANKRIKKKKRKLNIKDCIWTWFFNCIENQTISSRSSNCSIAENSEATN